MDYVEVKFFNDPSLNEVIIAWLGENDFDMFEEREDGLNAYINAGNFKQGLIEEAMSHIPGSDKSVQFSSSLIKDQNWNKKWESNFEPILVGGRVYIRAPFHEQKKEFQYEIIIEPKMSFGTGHHATTALMIGLMLQFDFKDKTVLDMGSGTGVLAILAEKLGAKNITAIDIDEWAFENCNENIERNDCSNINVIKGNVNDINLKSFDIILANINRNVLLNDMGAYVDSLNKSGDIFLSGILLSDKEVINNCVSDYGLTYITEANHENWLALYYKKN